MRAAAVCLITSALICGGEAGRAAEGKAQGDLIADRPKTAESKMLKVRSEQIEQMARAKLVGKLDAAFVRDVPGFSQLVKEERVEYFRRVIDAAEAKGFKTEQGIASYALGVWWVGMNFELASKELEALLRSDNPEVRRVHAMNEWVQEYLGNPDDIASADEKLRQALELTKPWDK